MTHEGGTENDGAGLLVEVERYLAAVEEFRAAGREPQWLPEPSLPGTTPLRHRNRRSSKSRGGIA
jgi:hypothetical protein